MYVTRHSPILCICQSCRCLLVSSRDLCSFMSVWLVLLSKCCHDFKHYFSTLKSFFCFSFQLMKIISLFAALFLLFCCFVKYFGVHSWDMNKNYYLNQWLICLFYIFLVIQSIVKKCHKRILCQLTNCYPSSVLGFFNGYYSQYDLPLQQSF